MANLKEARGYEEDFDTDWYLATFYDCLEGNLYEQVQTFYLDFFHDTFVSGNVGGERLLDIGTGPTVHTVISASPHVTEIHLSDFVDRHRTILQKWCEGADNVPTFFELILKKENRGESTKSRNRMMREKTKKIYHLDLLQDEPFADFEFKYDVITSSLCLDAVARNKKEFGIILFKVAEMLNPGGHLVMVGDLETGNDVIGEYKLSCLYITDIEVQDCLKRAGFVIQKWKTLVYQEYNDEGVRDISFAVLAQKA